VGFFFYQHDMAARLGQEGGSGGSGRPSADNKDIGLIGIDGLLDHMLEFPIVDILAGQIYHLIPAPDSGGDFGALPIVVASRLRKGTALPMTVCRGKIGTTGRSSGGCQVKRVL